MADRVDQQAEHLSRVQRLGEHVGREVGAAGREHDGRRARIGTTAAREILGDPKGADTPGRQWLEEWSRTDAHIQEGGERTEERRRVAGAQVGVSIRAPAGDAHLKRLLQAVDREGGLAPGCYGGAPRARDQPPAARHEIGDEGGGSHRQRPLQVDHQQPKEIERAHLQLRIAERAGIKARFLKQEDQLGLIDNAQYARGGRRGRQER